MELKDKKILILVEDMFNVFEFWYPFYRLKEAGAQVTVVGSGRTEEFTGKPGTQVRADINADQVSAGDYDGIIIPGGYAPDLMRRYPAMVKSLKICSMQEKLSPPFATPVGCWPRPIFWMAARQRHFSP